MTKAAVPVGRWQSMLRGRLGRLVIPWSLASVAHVLLSDLGFNPTDDGFVLARSRRIAAGEIPHDAFEVLADLNRTIGRLGPERYEVVVDAPGWWVCSKQRNPLSADWPQPYEVCSDEHRRRFAAGVFTVRGRVTFFVQRFQMVTIGDCLAPAHSRAPYFGAAAWIRARLDKTGEARFWAIYQ